MKKGGIINQELMSVLTGLGHGDTFTICDAGFPIPADAKKIDMALTPGVPTTIQVLKAVLNEVIVEEMAVAEEIQDFSPELLAEYNSIFVEQPKLMPQYTKFSLMAQKSKFFIRTGDLTPYANILLTSASGVRKYNEKFDASF